MEEGERWKMDQSEEPKGIDLLDLYAMHLAH